jgi:hypothetical protein
LTIFLNSADLAIKVSLSCSKAGIVFNNYFISSDVHSSRKSIIRGLGFVYIIISFNKRFILAYFSPFKTCARLAITSLRFILLCVPEPVCQITNGNDRQFTSQYFVTDSGNRIPFFYG